MSQAAAAAADGPVPAALRLEYAAPADGTSQQTAGRRRWRVISLVAMSPGLILPFLPMDCDLSAAKVLWKGGQELLGGAGLDRQEWGLWLLAMPYFLIFPLFVWKVRQLVDRPRVRAFRATVLTLGGLGAAALMGMLALSAWQSNPWDSEDWIFVGGATAVLALVGVLEAVLLVRPGRWDDQVTVALVGPYAVTLALCVAAWARSHQIAWYFALTPAAAGLAELVVIATSVWRAGDVRAVPPQPPPSG